VIFKKPYAFLIKNFRLIHLILTALIGYLLIRTYNIYSFFSRYVNNVYATLSDAVPSNYINIFMLLICIAIITFSLAMYFLMRKKDKPKTLYVSLSTYYFLYFLGLILYFILFKSMDSTQLSLRDAMLYRDLTLIIAIPQVILLILSLIRAVGFDIKKFNFTKDLKELDINEEDNEEFEFILGVDSYKYFRFLRRRIREFKYYILENKFMFTILMGLFGSVMLILTIVNFTVYNRTYGKNQKVPANNLILKVNNSYLTNIDQGGNIISKDKYFVVANITFTNSSGQSTVLDLSNYQLQTKSGKVQPTLSRNIHFIDFGAGYSKEKIPNDTTVTYILVFEINKKDVAKKYNLRITDSVEYKAGTLNAKYKNITLKPLTYRDTETVGNYQVGETATLYESILRNSSLTVDSYQIQNKFTYKYEACVRNNCTNVTDVVTAKTAQSKKLLVINGALKLDNNSTFAQNSKTSKSFFEAFVQVQYDDKIVPVEDATPKSLTEKYILQVDEKVSKAKKINLVITIRNQKYIIKLK